MTETRKKVNAVLLTAIMVLSVVAMGVTLTAGTAVANMHGDADDELEAGGTYWMGQVLWYERPGGAAPDHEDWQVRDGDTNTLQLEIAVDEGESHIIIETTELSEGTNFELHAPDGSGNVLNSGAGQFEIVEQSLSAEFAQDTVRSEDGPAGETQLLLSSNRGSYDVEVSADGISSGALESAFDDVEDTTADGVILNSRATTASFDGISPGDYEFTVEVVDTDAESTTNLTVEPEIDGSAELVETFPTENRGDWVTIPIYVEGTESITVSLGDAEDVNFESEVVLTNIGGDTGEVIDLQVNTYNVGHYNESGQNIALSDVYRSDAASVDSATEYPHFLDENGNSTDIRLEEGSYAIDVVVAGSQASDDRGTLRVTERSTDSMSVYVTDQSYGDVDDIEAMRVSMDEVSTEDSLAVEIEASGVYGNALDGGSLNAEDHGVEVTITQTDPGPHQDPEQLEWDDVEPVATVTTEPENNRFFLEFEMANLEGNYDEIEVGETYEIEFKLTGANPYVPAGHEESVSGTFTVVDNVVQFDPIEIAGAADQSVSGTTTLAPGNPLSVLVESDEDEHPFVAQQQIEVQSDQTWEATFADTFVGVPDGIEFTVEVIDYTEATGEVGTVTTPTPEPSTPTPTDAPTDTPEPDTDTPEPDTDTPEPDTDTPEPSDDEETPGFGLVVALLALAGAGLLAVRRRA